MSDKAGEEAADSTAEGGSAVEAAGPTLGDEGDSTGPAAANPAPRRGKGIRLLLLLLLAAIAGFAAFLWYVKRDAFQPVAVVDETTAPVEVGEPVTTENLPQSIVEAPNLDEELAPLRQQLVEMQRRQAAVEQSLTALADATASEIRELASRPVAVQAAPRADWQLAEAEYLTRLAGQRVALEENPTAAIALLENADQILSGIGLPELREARRQIAMDLSRLRSATQVDREGLYLRLEALAAGVGGLAGQRGALAWNVAAGEGTDEPGWFARQWRKLTALVSRYIVVRRQEPEQQPALEFSDEPLVQANMALLIRQAQLALLQQRDGIYRASLERLDFALDGYYGSAAETEALRAQIADLAAAEIVTELPDLIGSSRAIRDAIAALNGTGLDTQGAAQ